METNGSLTGLDMKRLIIAALAASFAIASSAWAQINVSPNVHVSASRAQQLQAEVIVDADPTRPGRLMACSLIYSSSKDFDPRWGVIVYLSENGGKSWARTFEEYPLMDPTCAYGPDGTAYLEAFEWRVPSLMRRYRSSDGGHKWEEPTTARTVDRPHLTIDRTEGRYRGRVYSHGQAGQSGEMDGPRRSSGVKLYASSDGGRTFGDPIQRESAGDRRTLGMGNGAILSDGTLVIVFGELKDYWNADGTRQTRDSQIGSSNGLLRIVTSNDGGNSLSPATTIADFYMHVYPWRPPAGHMPWIAVDTSNGPFRDRLYVAWPDRRSGRDEILLAYSTDRGKTWSKPTVINDDPAPSADRAGPDHFMPVLAVNKEGAVGVSWYDRRDHPDNLGWDVRFSASLDGGETWSPNIRVSEHANTFTSRNSWPLIVMPSNWTTAGPAGPASVELRVNQMMIYGGDTTGLVADPTGAFQIVWADNRTGMVQLWTSAVTVRGTAMRNRDASLAKLKDLTMTVHLEMSQMVYNRTTGELSVRARLRNVGSQPVYGPLKVRVIQCRSDLGKAEIQDAENEAKDAGAVWDFSSMIVGGVLPPGEASGTRDLRFLVSDVRPFLQGLRLRFGLVQLDVRVLGKSGSE